MTYPPPKPSQDKSPIWVWLTQLVNWMTSERVYIQGWKVIQKADGKHFIPPPQTNGQVVYFKACLNDGTTCYVPVLINGTIYRLPADTAGNPPTINPGKVPNGTVELV